MKQREPKVLFLPSWYPSDLDPVSGIFIRKHVLAAARFCDVAVLYFVTDPELRGAPFRVSQTEEEGVVTVRVYRRGRGRIPVVSVVRSFVGGLAAYWQGYRVVERAFGRPSFVHLCVAMPAGIMALALRYLKGIRFVITEHASIYTEYDGRFSRSSVFNRWITRLVYVNADAVSAVSGFLLGALRAHRLASGRAEIIPNVVESAGPVREHTPAGGCPKLLALSLLNDRDKNLSGLLRAFLRVNRIYPEAQLRLVGDGPDREKLAALACELGLSKRGAVVLSGYVPNSEIHKEYLDASFFVLNSNYETFSVATAEAIAHGVPVVVSRCGGPEEFVVPEVGILVERQSEESLAQGMIRMIGRFRNFDPRRLHRYAKERFGEEKVGRLLSEFYRMHMVTDNSGRAGAQ